MLLLLRHRDGVRIVEVAHPRVAADEEDLIQGDVVAGLGGEALDGDRVADADPVLLAAGLDDGVLDRTARRPVRFKD